MTYQPPYQLATNRLPTALSAHSPIPPLLVGRGWKQLEGSNPTNLKSKEGKAVK